jgi:uncharacterized protein
MTSSVSALLRTLFVTTVFGFVLSRIGFSSWDNVHAMFTFTELRMFLAFCLAVGALAVAWPLLERATGEVMPFRLRRIHRGSLIGGLLFGVGWAITGACPSIVWVQLGEGQLGAVWSLAGIFAGNYLYSVIHARYLRWDTGSCNE